jgi:hypothetical protein
MTEPDLRFEQHCFQHLEVKKKKAQYHLLHRHRRHRLPIQLAEERLRPYSQLVAEAAEEAKAASGEAVAGQPMVGKPVFVCQDVAAVAEVSSACRVSGAGAAGQELAVEVAEEEPLQDEKVDG